MRRITSLTETGMRITPPNGAFQPVDDFLIVDESMDLRGRNVMENDALIGTVTEMLVDPDEQRVAMIELSDGRRVAIETVRLKGRDVYLNGG